MAPPLEATANAQLHQLLAADNLVAWCIVPFDAAKRGQEDAQRTQSERTKRGSELDQSITMLKKLEAALGAT